MPNNSAQLSLDLMRVPKWVSGVAIAIMLVGIPVALPFLLSAWIVHGTNVYADIMREGSVIAAAIHEHDPSVHVGWTTDGHGHPNIVIRDPLDAGKQDQVIQWAKAAKARGRVHRRIVIGFSEGDTA